MHSSELDSIDWNILSALQDEARIANFDLADKVHLSPSPCLARVKALEQKGFISRYVTLLNAQAVGLGVSVFVQVRLEKQVEASLNTFEKAIAARPEVMECYLMTGSSDYLLRVVVSDLQEFQRFVTDVSKIPGAAEGDDAMLIGSRGSLKVDAAELAELSGTVPYEILCGISKRVPRVHLP